MEAHATRLPDALRRSAPGDRLRDSAALVGVAVCGAALTAAAISSGSLAVRLAAAIACVMLLLALFERDRLLGVIGSLTFLVALALLRRMLLIATAANAFDPMLLVGPTVAVVVCLRLFATERRPLAPDSLSLLVCATLAIAVLEAANPGNGTLLVGLGGVLFLGVPLLWFFIGRELVDNATRFERVLLAVVAVGTLAAAYGLFQHYAGLPSWDATWANTSGYIALHGANGSVSVFGPFSSSAEFSVFVGIAAVVATALGVSGRSRCLAALPLLLLALVLSSSRSATLLSVGAIVLVLLLRVFPARVAPLALVVVVLAVVLGGPAISSLSRAGAQKSSNTQIQYQLSGVGNPTGSNSTLKYHWQLFTAGIRKGIDHPVGTGTGTANRAGAVLDPKSVSQGSSGGGTEVDISNNFAAFGVLGGLLFLALIFTGLREALRNFAQTRDGAALAALGLLVCSLGGWDTGGYYAAAPLIWLTLGATAAMSMSRRTGSQAG